MSLVFVCFLIFFVCSFCLRQIQSLWGDTHQLALCLPSEEDRRLVSQTFADQADASETENPEVLKLINEAIEVRIG